MNLQDVSHIHIPDGDVRMIHDSDNRLLWGAVGYNVLFSGNTFQQTYEGKNLFDVSASQEYKWLRAEDGVVVDSSDPNIVGPLLHVVVGTTYVISGIGNLQLNLFTYSDDSFSNPVRAINNSRTARTFTATTEWLRFSIGGGNAIAIKNDIQFEVGSTATSFEPYVGGTPTPNPDYPQPIQTVTGLQTVEIQSKNLLNPNSSEWQQGYWTYGGGSLIASSGRVCQINKTPVYEETTFTFTTDMNIAFRVDFWNLDGSASGHFVGWFDPTATNITKTFTVPANMCYTITLGWKGGGVLAPSDVASHDLQLELGSTATTYAPYSHQTLPLDLGSIELCKLGNYQDYIWKDGEDWKVHKETIKRTFTGSSGWSWDATVPRLSTPAASWGVVAPPDVNTPILGYSSKFKAGPFWYIYNQRNNGFAYSNSAFVSVVDKSWESEEDARAAFAGTTFYFAAATPTDTTITDQTLIAQLEAIYNLVRRYGYNFVVSASGNNLPIIIDRTLL